MIRYLIVTGEPRAKQLAAELITRSKWFQLTPLPDDEWQFDVKAEPGLPWPNDWSTPPQEVDVADVKQEPRFFVFNETDGIYADSGSMTRAEAEAFMAEFPKRFEGQGYYASTAGRIPISELRLSLLPEKKKRGLSLLPEKRGRKRALTPENVREAREMYAAKNPGWTVRGIAHYFKVSEAVIHRALNGPA